ncbi:MAG: DUF2059 domain-containing protein [Brevundimonas sp.]|uniref:DUF2059 domain-containing protein n=1 Tax=Brevundimonas sp. TaxID=1871086 RepID=UPI0025B90CF1|nr:DUF2059 domain-containing protein [Brevundimonas sp.]MBX3478394.1 DUF2059 domain-containing protein [Brevundimonas sp.]
MSRILGLVAALCLAFASPVLAQEPDARRVELAERLMEASQGDYLNNLSKLMEQEVTSAMGGMETLPADQAAWLRRNVPDMAVRMVQDMLPRIATLYAETFTEEELEAQLALYEGPLGRSIANKGMRLGIAQAQLMQEAQVRYLQEMITKFCADFDCAAGIDSAKPARR